MTQCHALTDTQVGGHDKLDTGLEQRMRME